VARVVVRSGEAELQPRVFVERERDDPPWVGDETEGRIETGPKPDAHGARGKAQTDGDPGPRGELVPAQQAEGQVGSHLAAAQGDAQVSAGPIHDPDLDPDRPAAIGLLVFGWLGAAGDAGELACTQLESIAIPAPSGIRVGPWGMRAKGSPLNMRARPGTTTLSRPSTAVTWRQSGR
jgi:hypothetical protein